MEVVNVMKRDSFTIRLERPLALEVIREARRRGIKRATWASHLVERGLLGERLEKLFEDGAQSGANPFNSAAAMPPEIMQRLLFAACFSEAILKKLNASLNRSTSELGIVAAQARDQAQAETTALLKAHGE